MLRKNEQGEYGEWVIRQSVATLSAGTCIRHVGHKTACSQIARGLAAADTVRPQPAISHTLSSFIFT